MTGLWGRVILAGTVTVAMLGAGTGAASALPAAAPAAAVTGNLAAVSCASATSCVAVGGRSSTSTAPGGTLAEKWNGTKWSVVSSPNPGTDGARLYGVACTSTTQCMAVGIYFTASSTTLPMAEEWNGSKWSLINIPAPSGAGDAYLQAVACASATSCRAVGGNSDATLTEAWNGTKWSIVSSPSPHPGRPNVLSGVACPSVALCWAVGYDFPTDFSGSLTEKWNGKAWSVVSTPNSKAGELIGDECTSATACLAVGIGNKLFALGQKWNGANWSTITPKRPSKATSTELNGVSCASATACESVGTYSLSSGSPALAESWNGTAWAVQATPAVSGLTYAALAGVSCATASDCWAAGEWIGSGGASTPLLEQWDGTSWSLG